MDVKTSETTRKVSRYIGCRRPEAKRRQQKWVKFIKITRPAWTASRSSMVCSEHFASEDFCRMFHFKSQDYQKRLVRDEIGITAIPRFHDPNKNDAKTQEAMRNVSLSITNHFTRGRQKWYAFIKKITQPK